MLISFNFCNVWDSSKRCLATVRFWPGEWKKPSASRIVDLWITEQEPLRCYLIHSTKTWVLTCSSGVRCPSPNTGPTQSPTSQHTEDPSSHAGQISMGRDFCEDIKIINVGQSHPNLSSKSTSVGLQKKDSKKQLHNLSKTRYPKTWPKEQLCRGGLKLSTSPLLQPANPTCEVPISKVLSSHQRYKTGP